MSTFSSSHPEQCSKQFRRAIILSAEDNTFGKTMGTFNHIATGCSHAQSLSQVSRFVDPSFSSVDLTFVTNSSDICTPPSP